MGFFLQLQLLVWKNFILRKRQKIRCLVELIWPLFLFSILMWVRTRGLKTYVDECHFQEKAMPSAGQLPFLQSFFCSFNNTCHSTIKATEYGTDNYYNNSILSRLGKDMEELFKNDTLMKKWQKVQNVGRDVQELTTLLKNIINREKTLTGMLNVNKVVSEPAFLKSYAKKENIKLDDNVLDSLYNAKIALQNISLGHVFQLGEDPKSLLCDREFLRHILVTREIKDLDAIVTTFCAMPSNNITNLYIQIRKQIRFAGIRDEAFTYIEGNLGRTLEWEQWRQLNKLTFELFELIQGLDSYQEILKRVVTAGEEYRIIISALRQRNTSAVYSNFLLAQHFICGDSAEDVINQIAAGGGVGEGQQFDSLKEQLKIIHKDTEDSYENDTDASPECNQMFQKLEQSAITRFLWLQLKPFFRGKILYAPDNSAGVRRVMERINKTFETVQMAKESSKYWVNFTLPLAGEQLVNNTANIQLMKDFIDSDIGQTLLTSIVNNKAMNRIFTADVVNRVEYVQQLADRLLQENNTAERASVIATFGEVQINITRLLDCFDVNKTEGFDSEESAMARAMELLEKKKLWALVSFLDIDDLGNNSNPLPPFVAYKIRMDSERVDSTRQVEDRLRRPGPRRRPAVDLKYITYGFAYLQDLIEQSIIMEQTGRNRTPGIFLKQFPYPCHIIDRFVLAISRTFPMFMTLSWVYSCSMLIKSIVYEKERRLKETMRVMGLGNAVHWFGWFIDSFVPMLVTVIFLTLILVYGKVLERSDPTVVFVFLLVYCMTTIMKSFLISVFFSRANLAAAAGGIIFFILYLPYPFMVIWEEHISTTPKVVTSLLSNVAFGFGCSYFAHYEEMGVGIQWHNMNSSPVLGDHYNLQYAIMMLILDAIIYSILTWYIETAFPGQYGIPKPWYFPVTISYWFPEFNTHLLLMNENIIHEDFGGSNSFEQEPNNQTMGVSIKNLNKVYNNGKVALQNLNINFYENHITSFLGHNGAGKTTTISILTGLFPPSSGTAVIYSLDIRKDMDRIRRSLGMCPQHNVLFDQLNVEEHLWFYARLKGHPVHEVLQEIKQMLEDLGLPDKKHALARQLSGGMQRKLSIAAAFIGGSKTVILDEPTSGVDPFSRRSIWELLIKYKQGRTVILTTHFMDEADLLGDRIAIIANGKLQCCGSSLFLKAKYGHGYYLTIETSKPISKPDVNRVEDGRNVVSQNGTIGTSIIQTAAKPSNQSGISDLIKSVIPSVTLVQQLGTEIVYNLPETHNKEVFEKLFNILDGEMGNLGIISYGISDTTLEEIFLHVADQGEHESQVAANGSVPLPDISGDCFETGNTSIGKSFKHLEKQCLPLTRCFKRRSSREEFTMKILDGKQSNDNIPTMEPNIDVAKSLKTDSHSWKWQQFIALHVKRFHHTKRNPKALFCELVVPAVFVCMALAFTVILPKLMMPPPLAMEPWIYPPPNYVFFSNDAPQGTNTWSQRYQTSLLGDVGMGTKCVERNETKWNTCDPVEVGNLSYPSSSNITTAECSCAVGTLQCPANAAGPEPPRVMVATGDFMVNVTGRNISDWIVKTTAAYYKTRYGGFTFGIRNPLGLLNLTRLAELMHLADRLTGIGNITKPVMLPALKDAANNLTRIINPAHMDKDLFDNIRVWFNNKGWASSVSYMNAINNVILRASLPEHKQSDRHLYGIQVINHPVNFSKTQINHELIQQSGISLLHAISVIFALSFVPASFVVFLIEERVSNAKHQQFVSGANRLVYWVAAYCWDMASYMVSALLCIFVFLAFNEQAYVSETNITGLVLLLVLYGWSSIPLMYPASFIFSIPSSAFVTLACANLFIGIVTTVATFVLEIFDDAELQYIASIIRQVFLIFPHFCLGQGLMNMATRHLTAKALATYGIEVDTNIFEWGFLGKNLFCMLISGIIFFLFNLMIEYKILFMYKSYSKAQIPKLRDEEEEDVATERLRVESGEADNDILLIKNLTKIYGRSRPAVNRLCVGVKKGECFGLLGLNGAGKTSTFKMLTGDTGPSSGDAFVTGFSIRHEMDKVRMHLGYCPQFDALDPLLTPREHLQLYCRLRGIPSASRDTAVNSGLQQLGLEHYADRCSGTLSGGNKRKLSTAIALVGNPPLVFLDEPTSGMDPKARRFLWSRILNIVAEGRSVVLTSHSMEECEALCTKLTIMVNGHFMCFGSSQHLKNKFGCGYSLQVRCKSDTLGTVTDYVKLHLSSATLKETHYNQLRFQLPPDSFKLSNVFRIMENARNQELLLDYSISQTTLEEVFLRFANTQNAEVIEDRQHSELHPNV